ncbi:MAG: hypothetical protein HN742_16910 [Lentisphaerae bacterium]|jgi:zinc D-Ala-D-Ala dipeptidase|nr:hypothetical protein [Lentisphaerota bacterium]MBT4818317.1 hypothetical protein [Lentisphaerota bacterium]MBT5604342.1 hypothetical protein [Lentisphaerota bacterium]MBT7054185.1 hypothetical protein [Lentisphaerota bacterium]MBT7843562.1 hypothetical protein [Lentisphaerota bacterium]
MDPRTYWAEQLDEAHAFMQRLLAHPIREAREPMCSLTRLARDCGVRIDCPSGKKLGFLERTFWVRRSVAERLVAVAEAMLEHDRVLRVEDAWRSIDIQIQGAGCDFILDTVHRKVLWERRGEPPGIDLLMRRISVLTATTPKFANHTSGSAVDISVLRRNDGGDLDRGGPYLELSEKTPMASPFISEQAQRNRAWINETMGDHGFHAYPYEFWHYSFGDVDWAVLTGEERPAPYGPVDFSPETGAVIPVADERLLEPLLPRERVSEYLERAGRTSSGGP